MSKENEVADLFKCELCGYTVFNIIGPKNIEISEIILQCQNCILTGYLDTKTKTVKQKNVKI